ncbi:hypothetical protein M9Y10_008399 [Tritrichomonas musculus]|uniref:Uncharacterized protein n=1 Tax=Tritrichomonas musculus TaxID=1915356 RepID=A0ABR2IY36_9EUKA
MVKCTYILFITILIISLFAALNDTIFPINNSTSNVLDCETISVVNFNSDEGQITLQVRIPESFEYPKQNIFSFLSINVVTHYFSNSQNHFNNLNNTYYYSSQISSNNQYNIGDEFVFESSFDFENGFYDSKMINSTDFLFNIYYQFYGHHCLTLKCFDSNIFKTEIDFNNITHFQPNTTIVENPSKFRNICYADQKFYAILPQTGYFSELYVGDYMFPFDILKKRKGFRFSGNSSFLFTNFRYKTWQQILFQLTPLLNILKNSDEVRLFTVTKNDKDVKMPSIFKSRILTYSDLHVCFESLEILSEINRYEIRLKPFKYDEQSQQHKDKEYIDNSYLIEEALFDQSFSITSEIALQKPITKEKFAISSDLHSYFKIIEENFPDIEIFEITENTTCAEMAFQFGDVSVLIGTKIDELVGSVFLNKDAVVVDMQSYRCFCGDWMKKFSSKLGLKYISFDQECDCDNFSCSDLIDWEMPIKLDEKEILSIIEQLF